MDLSKVVFKSDLHKYCFLCFWGKKRLPMTEKNMLEYAVLDEEYKHHRISNHQDYARIMHKITVEFQAFHLRQLLQYFTLQERDDIELETLEYMTQKANSLINQ